MEIDGESILHPKPADILGPAPDLAMARIRAEWDAELNWPRLDLERLTGCGQLARHRRLLAVESQLKAWLQQNTTDRAFDVAGLFLMGYWAGTQDADGALIQLLLAKLQQSPPDDPVRDTLIAALGGGHRNTRDRSAADDVEREFQRIWQDGTYNPSQRITVDSLRQVLGK